MMQSESFVPLKEAMQLKPFCFSEAVNVLSLDNMEVDLAEEKITYLVKEQSKMLTQSGTQCNGTMPCDDRSPIRLGGR